MTDSTDLLRLLGRLPYGFDAARCDRLHQVARGLATYDIRRCVKLAFDIDGNVLDQLSEVNRRGKASLLAVALRCDRAIASPGLCLGMTILGEGDVDGTCGGQVRVITPTASSAVRLKTSPSCLPLPSAGERILHHWLGSARGSNSVPG